MKYLKKLFSIKPNIGWGEASAYEAGNVQHISEAVGILSYNTGIILERASHISSCKSKGELKMDYNKWIECKKQTDTYLAYMLNNFSRKDGEFLINLTEIQLDDLAKIYLLHKTKTLK